MGKKTLWFELMIWGEPWALLSLLWALFLWISGHEHRNVGASIQFKMKRVRKDIGCVTFGVVSLFSQSQWENDYVKKHEFGHVLQLSAWGVFMIVIDLISLSTATYYGVYRKIKGKVPFYYYSTPVESNASRLGLEWCKKHGE